MPPKPLRRPASQFPAGRPVVALLDTGVREHDWLVETDGEPYWEEAEGWTPLRTIPEIAGQESHGEESDVRTRPARKARERPTRGSSRCG